MYKLNKGAKKLKYIGEKALKSIKDRLVLYYRNISYFTVWSV